MPARVITDREIVFPDGKQPNWKHTDEGMAGGRFGKIVHIAVCSGDGTFLFDRPVVEEGPHVITLTFGRDPRDGKVKLALIKESRDTAASLSGDDTYLFWGPPRGFSEPGEQNLIATARREAGEEAGARVLAGTPWVVGEDFITNETCTRSHSPFVAIPVDLTRLYAIKDDPARGEKIFKAKFFSAEEIDAMILDRIYDGASTRSMVLITAAMLFRIHVLRRVTLETLPV